MTVHKTKRNNEKCSGMNCIPHVSSSQERSGPWLVLSTGTDQQYEGKADFYCISFM